MDVDELLDLPAPHARVAARRAQKLKEEQMRAAAQASSQTPTSVPTTPGAQSPQPAATADRPANSRYPSQSVNLSVKALPSRPIQAQDGNEARIVLALDYGTTFTGVAYAWSVGQPISADEIYVVQNWPGSSNVKVPSEYSYSYSKKGLQNFGYHMDEDAKVLSKTKLELLDSEDRGRELTTFTEVLHGLAQLRLDDDADIAGEVTEHLYKTAEDVVRDYLEKIASVTMGDMVERLTKTAVDQTPIDMIITHPANWPKSARNKTYRAAMAAFGREFPKLRDVSFVSEPEACAHYTLNAAQLADHARFRKDDCVVVVDAGGGTVDLASFQITSIDTSQSKFGMKQIGKITGRPCGATHVDVAFMKLLKDRLGPVDSEKIVNSGPYGDGGHFIWTKAGRDVFQNFIPIKHDFTGTLLNPFTAMDLPHSLDIQDRPDKGIRNGKLQLTAEDIESVFRDSVDKTKAAVLAQIGQLRHSEEQYTVKSVFLSGGFAQSPYLFTQLSALVGGRGITVERGLDCWSAVTKGAVMKGLGLLTEKPPPTVRCPCHLGIKTRQAYAPWRITKDEIETDSLGFKWTTDQVKWFVRKDDAIDPDGTVENYEYRCNWLVLESELEPPAKKPVKEAGLWGRREGAKKDKDAEEDKPREVLREIVLVFYGAKDALLSFKGLKESAVRTYPLQCDLTKTPREERVRHDTGGNRYIKVNVVVKLSVKADQFTAQVVSGDKTLSKEVYFKFEEWEFKKLKAAP